MKPPASPAFEYRLFAGAQLLGGLVFGVVAAAVQDPAAADVGLLLAGALFGTGMYVLAYRRFARRAVERVAAPPTSQQNADYGSTTACPDGDWFLRGRGRRL
jgi:hypothetical protein